MFRTLGYLMFVGCLVTASGIREARAQDTAAPIGSIAVGDSPFALALSDDDRQAVVVNLFPVQNPDGSEGPNIRVLDVGSQSQTNSLRVGTRLVAVAVTGSTALVVNEDQDVLRVVDVTTATEIAQIPVGSRPSNVSALNSTTAMVTNGTSGDVTFVDIPSRTVKGSAVTVGLDPRAAASHPGGQFVYVTLGGENAIAVLDVSTTPETLLTKISVGRDPVAIAVTPDGTRAVVANLTSNTVSVLDLSTPSSPRLLMNVPVGVQPTSLAVNPVTPNIFYVANLGSSFFSVVDISQSQRTALTGVVQMGTASSGIQITSDGTRLLIAEFKNQASVRIYDLGNMPLAAVPSIDLPGEPRTNTFLESTGDCSTSFYITEVTLASGQPEGFWGMEVLVSDGELTGGFNLGGGFEGNGLLPGFGGFSLATPQTVGISVNAQQLPGTTGAVALNVELLKDNIVIAGTMGPPPLSLNADLQTGFHVVRITSLGGTPRGTFQMALTAQAFSGGVVVGGFITPELTGFGSFCLPVSQNVDIRLVGSSEFSTAAAGDLVLTVKDFSRSTLRTVSNGIPVSSPVTPPTAPSTDSLLVDWYVDDDAGLSGSGTVTNPFRGISQAIEAAGPGEVIFVQAGTYSPSKTGETIPIGSPGTGIVGLRAGVTLIGAGAETTIIDGESIIRSDNNGNALIIPVDGVRFTGFTVRGAAQVGLFVSNADNVVIEGNLFTSNTRFGIGASGSRGLIVRNNVVVSNLESGITVSGATSFALSNAPTNCPASAAGDYGAYIVNNTSNDNRADGILVSQGGNVCVADNVTNNNGSSGIEFNNRVEVGTVPPLNGVMVNNDLANNGGVQFGFAGTGILVTEDAQADLIQSNTLRANRPFGIGIFLNGRATLISSNDVRDSSQQGILVQRGSTVTEISDNTVRNNGLSGLFVENQATVTSLLRNVSTENGTGLSILDRSVVTTADQNTFDRNGVGMEISGASTGTAITNNTLDGNSSGGVFVRESSTLTAFTDNKVRNNKGQGGMLISGSVATIGANEITSNQGPGISLFLGAVGTIQDTTITNNDPDGGVFLNGGSQATIVGATIRNNERQGILAAGSGTIVTLSGGNTIQNTELDSAGSGGIGLNAQNGGRINCSGSNTLGGNVGGNTLGTVTGCQ